jgi:hypothetical protein
MEILIAAIVIGIVVAIQVRVYAWIANNTPSTPGSASPVINKFKSDLLLEDYQKKEDRN